MDTKLYFFECGTLKSQKHYFTLNKGVGEPFEVPVPFFLIQHNGKNILFDTGNGIEASTNPEEHWGETIEAYYPEMTQKQFVSNQLKDILNIAPEQIEYVIFSHLHLDHAGGVGVFPNATYIVHKKEFDWAFNPECAQKSAYIMKDIKKDVNWQKLEMKFGEPYDLFGDGVIKIYLTPGHTPGHMSVLVKLKDNSFLLTADSCYTEENLNDNVPPGLVWSEDASIKTLASIKELQAQGSTIIVGHDPYAWKNVKKAPEFYL